MVGGGGGGGGVFYDASLCQVCSYVGELITCEEASRGQRTETILYSACGHPGEEIGVFYMWGLKLYYFWITHLYVHRSVCFYQWKVHKLISRDKKHTGTNVHVYTQRHTQSSTSRNPVSIPMSWWEYAAGPLLYRKVYLIWRSIASMAGEGGHLSPGAQAHNCDVHRSKATIESAI